MFIDIIRKESEIIELYGLDDCDTAEFINDRKDFYVYIKIALYARKNGGAPFGACRRLAGYFLTYRQLRKTDLAVMPCLSIRKATVGEHKAAGTARFFNL